MKKLKIGDRVRLIRDYIAEIEEIDTSLADHIKIGQTFVITDIREAAWEEFLEDDKVEALPYECEYMTEDGNMEDIRFHPYEIVKVQSAIEKAKEEITGGKLE